MTLTPANLAIWAIAALATAGVVVRPFKLPEAVWAVLGGLALLVLGLLRWGEGLRAIGKGTDVYLFLTGMMLLSETARRESLFNWVAAAAVNRAELAKAAVPTRLRGGRRGHDLPVQRRRRRGANARSVRRRQEG